MKNFWYTRSFVEEPRNYIFDSYLKNNKAVNDGEFWFDQIQSLKKQPDLRIKKGLENLPFPAAFREIAKGLRTIIRNKKQQNIAYDKELSFLYKIACVESFMIPYAGNLKQPGYNVMINVPGKTLFGLETNYNVLGTDKLSLLTKTDIKLMHFLWGVPKKHITMHEIYYELWKDTEDKLIQKEDENRKKFRKEITNLLNG